MLKNNLALILRNSRQYNYIILVSMCFVLLIFIFVINEYKINSMRWPQYFLIVWFWLGFGNSILNTAKYSKL